MGAKTRFRGSFTALVTPFKNGSLDEKAFRELVDWQIGEGTNGLAEKAGRPADVGRAVDMVLGPRRREQREI